MVADRNRYVDTGTTAVLQRHGEHAAGPGPECRLCGKADTGFYDEGAPALGRLGRVGCVTADPDRIGAVLPMADVRGTDLQDIPRGTHPVSFLDYMSPSRIEVRIIGADAEFMDGVAPLGSAHAERKARRFARHDPALGFFYNDILRSFALLEGAHRPPPTPRRGRCPATNSTGGLLPPAQRPPASTLIHDGTSNCQDLWI